MDAYMIQYHREAGERSMAQLRAQCTARQSREAALMELMRGMDAMVRQVCGIPEGHAPGRQLGAPVDGMVAHMRQNLQTPRAAA